MEQVTIMIERYKTPEGEPTCCEDLKQRKFGTEWVCMLGETKPLFEYDGYLHPRQDCEVWQNR